LLRRTGRHPLRGGDHQRPHAVRRGCLLLAGGMAAMAFAPHAAADTTTTPAPDPNPPPGAVPDPYAPRPKAPPVAPRPVARVVTPRVQPTPRYVAPPHTTTSALHTVAPSSHPRGHTAARRKSHSARRQATHPAAHRKRVDVPRVTPRLEAYITSFVDALNANIPGRSGSADDRHRREAGVALALLCVVSLTLLVTAMRANRVAR
jgi:hypothetical protein